MSCSNLYFGLHSSYFDPLSLSRPALQTWSLGVEEQFYLLFPPALVLLHRFARKRLAAALFALAALSFLLSVQGAFRSPTLAFFMPWTRACELLGGGLLATGAVPRTASRLIRNVAAAIGLLLLAVAFSWMNGAVPFPGPAVLVPCGGAGLLIWSGQGKGVSVAPPTMAARLLGSKPLVAIGLISYSLYLWHWPLIVFQGISLWGDGFSPRSVKVVIVLLSFALGTLSYHLIEKPFRDGALRLEGAGAFRFAAGSSLALGAAGVAILLLHGLPGRFPAQAVAVGSYVGEPANNRFGTCMVIRARDFRPDLCLREEAGRPNWLVVGDSHAAAQQWQGLVRAFPAVHFLQMSRASCRPDPAQMGGDCGALNHFLFAHYLPSHHVDRMVVDGRWAASDVAAVDRTVVWAKAHEVPLTLIGPTQDYDAPLPRLLAYGIMRHDPGLAERHRIAGTAELDRRFAELARERWHVPYISLVRMFCPAETRGGGACQAYVDPRGFVPLLTDGDHLSNEGSVLAGQRMARERLLPDGTVQTARVEQFYEVAEDRSK